MIIIAWIDTLKISLSYQSRSTVCECYVCRRNYVATIVADVMITIAHADQYIRM